MDNNELVINTDGMIMNGFDPRQYAAEHPDAVNVVDAGTAPRYELAWEDLTAALHGVTDAAANAADTMGTVWHAIDGVAADIRRADTDARATADGGFVTRQNVVDAIRHPNLGNDIWDIDPFNPAEWPPNVDTVHITPQEMQADDLTHARDAHTAEFPPEPWIGERIASMGRSMSLGDDTAIIIKITGVQEFRLKFAGYFSENIMDEVIAQYIGEEDAGIIQETGAVVFRYSGNVVAVTPDHYHTQECFDTCEDGVIIHRMTPQAVRYGISPEHLMLVWNCGDETVGTKEPLVVMDRAFDEVFQ